MNPEGVPIADLLIHADFVRRLARDLIRDPHGAEDLAQEVWVKALKQPPQHGSSVRGWLATLLQNVWHNRRRDEQRRRAREQHATPPAAMPSAEDILEREQVRERLVHAVLRLDEPFRSAVLLRYYEDLSSAAIAQRLGVPAATVRTRLARGLARLREQLEVEGGARRAWTAPIASWTRIQGAAAATGFAAGVAMKKLVFVLAAAAVLFSLAFVVPWRDEPNASLPTAMAASAESGPWAEREGTIASSPQRQAVAVGGTPIDVTAVPVFAADRGLGAIVGDLVDEHEEPLPGIEVVAEPMVGTLPPRMQLRDDRTASRSARTDAAGRFRIDGVAAGPTRVRALLAGDRRARGTAVVVRDGEEGPLRLRAAAVDLGDCLRVRAIAAGGEAEPQAQVEVFAWSADDVGANQLADPRTEPIARGTTDSDGKWQLRGRSLRSGVVFVKAADGRIGRGGFHIASSSGGGTGVDVAITLAPAGTLRGTFSGADGLDLEGALVSLHAFAIGEAHGYAYRACGSRRFDARVQRGSFDFTDLPAGSYGVTLAALGGARLIVEPVQWGGTPMPNSARIQSIDIVRGATQQIELGVAAGGRVRGLVRCEGRPVTGARIRAVLAPRTSNFPAGFVLRGAHVWRFDNSWENAPNDPLTHVEAITDRHGAYELRSLQPGSHRVEVVANGLCYDRRMDVSVQDGAVVELTHDLVAAGVLQFAAHALDGKYVGVTAVGNEAPTMLLVAGGNFVTLPGLAPGRYHIARFHSSPSVEPVVLGTADVHAGRTTWLDLRAASVSAVVVGRVTSGGQPVAGARVQLQSVAATTDAFGSFRLALGHGLGLGSFTPHVIVRQAAIATTFAIDASGGPRQLDVEFELGSRHVTIAVVDAAGLPVAARLEMKAVVPKSESAGLRSADVNRLLTAGRETRIGPLPDLPLQGEVVFAGSVRVPFALPLGVGTVQVACPPTGTLRAVVKKKDGSPPVSLPVKVWTWQGSGAPPSDDRAFGENMIGCHSLTDANGYAEFAVPVGDSVVFAGDWGDSPTRRVRITPGGTASVELAMKW